MTSGLLPYREASREAELRVHPTTEAEYIPNAGWYMSPLVHASMKALLMFKKPVTMHLPAKETEPLVLTCEEQIEIIMPVRP